jgi:hypothetical protein
VSNRGSKRWITLKKVLPHGVFKKLCISALRETLQLYKVQLLTYQLMLNHYNLA